MESRTSVVSASYRSSAIHRCIQSLLLSLLPLTAQMPQAAAAKPAEHALNPDEGLTYRAEFIDRSVDPCQDFYRFALGKWLQQAPSFVLPHQSSLGYDTELLQRQEAVIREILTKNTGSVTPEARLVRVFHANLLHGPRGQGLAPLQQWIERIDHAVTLDDVAVLLGALHRSGIRALWDWSVEPSERNPRQTEFRITGAWTGLPGKAYYTSENEEGRSLREDYRAYLAKVLLHPDWAVASTKDSTKAILDLETHLAQNTLEPLAVVAARRSSTPLKRQDLERQFAGFPWGGYLRALGLGPDSQMLLVDPSGIRAAIAWLATAPEHHRKAYLKVCLFKAMAPYLDTPERDQHWSFWKQRLEGQTVRISAEQGALHLTRTLLGMPLSRECVRRTFRPETRRQVQEMVEGLRRTVILRLQACGWLSPGARDMALAKAKRFQVLVGHPRRWPTIKGLRIDAEHLVATNVLAILGHKTRLLLAKAGKPTDVDDWGDFSPLNPTAMADSQRCRVLLCAGIIQPPYFHAQAAIASNYGGLGCVLGHEIAHLFDENGRNYDAEGRLVDEWSPEDEHSYRQEADKLKAQINAYEVLPGVHGNPDQTLAEAMADQVGVQWCFDAFKTRIATKGHQADRHGFTPEQQFFLAYAESYRFWQREEALKDSLRWETHSTCDFSVNGPLANLEGFRRAFGCKEGSRMVRPEPLRPRLW